MDGLRPTLPHLLDLNATPSYQNSKPANAGNRPTTTNFGATNSAQKFAKRSKKSSTLQPRTPYKTTTGFYNSNNTKKQAEVEDFQTFRFSEFQSLHKNLPRLYTPSQYQSASHKLNNLKERYQNFYVKTDGIEGENPELLVQENLKEVVLEAEKVFNATYSVKYFGVKDNTLGIVSKRVPMNNVIDKQHDKAKYIANKGASASRKQKFYQEQNAQGPISSFMHGSKSSQLSWGFGAWKDGENARGKVEHSHFSAERDVRINEQNDGSISPIKGLHDRNPSNGLSDTKMRAATASTTMRTVLYPHKDDLKVFNEERINEEEAMNEENNGEEEYNESYHYEQLAREAQLRAQLEANPEGAKYVVTQYFVPKKLQGVKKKPEEENKGSKQVPNPKMLEVQGKADRKSAEIPKIAGDPFEGVGRDDTERIWQKVVIADQTASNNADFERKLMSLGKVKRSLLRNVRVEKAWENRPYKDELDVQEKFRTHEVQKVMADNAKYSYAKLLGTMQTNERPETALISNTEKMEKILSIRKEKRKMMAPKGDEEFDMVEKEKKGTNGRYMVKVWYPKENEMFNRFVKIRANLGGPEQEVN